MRIDQDYLEVADHKVGRVTAGEQRILHHKGIAIVKLAGLGTAAFNTLPGGVRLKVPLRREGHLNRMAVEYC